MHLMATPWSRDINNVQQQMDADFDRTLEPHPSPAKFIGPGIWQMILVVPASNQTWQWKISFIEMMVVTGKSFVNDGFSVATFDCRGYGTRIYQIHIQNPYIDQAVIIETIDYPFSA